MAVGVVAALLIVDAAVVWARIDRTDAGLAGSGASSPTYLLIGSDRRVDVPDEDRPRFGTDADVPGERADIVILVRRDGDGRVRALAVPRDLVLFRTDRGPERMAPMLQDGAGAVADALCNSLGIGVDHAAVIGFDGLADLVDLVDGVEVTPAATYLDRSSGLMMRAGRQRIDGRTALAYVRARNVERREGNDWIPDPEESGRRTDRALEVLRGLAPSVRPSWNPWFDQRLAWTASSAVTVDADSGPLDLLDLAGVLSDLDPDSVTTLPVLTRGGSVPTASLIPDSATAIHDFTGTDAPSPRCDPAALLDAS